MTILSLFNTFFNQILEIKVFDISLMNYLVSILIIIFIFKILIILASGQSNGKARKEKVDKND